MKVVGSHGSYLKGMWFLHVLETTENGSLKTIIGGRALQVGAPGWWIEVAENIYSINIFLVPLIGGIGDI